MTTPFVSIAPPTAITFPVPEGPTADDLLSRAKNIAEIVQTTADENTRDTGFWLNDCAEWLANGVHYQQLGMSVPPKPALRALRIVDTEDQPDGSIKVWIDALSFIGPPCPDLPAAPAPRSPAWVIRVGVSEGGGYFQCIDGDTVPIGQVVTAQSSQGTVGKFWKDGDPWGSWYTNFPPAPRA